MCRVIMRKELNVVPKINVVFRGVTILVKTYKINQIPSTNIGKPCSKSQILITLAIISLLMKFLLFHERDLLFSKGFSKVFQHLFLVV